MFSACKDEAPTAECKICHNTKNNRTIIAQEMMIGLGGSFEYMECSECGCVQRSTLIPDASIFYPSRGYYSFRPKPGPLVRWMHKLRARGYFGGPWWSRQLASIRPRADLAAVAQLHPGTDWRILDVGCGAGKLLREMGTLGFRHLFGIDPFLDDDIETDGVKILKRDLRDMGEDGWDLIMFHHSLEHISEQREMMRAAAALLKPGGVCLVRIPVVGWAWRNYGENWVQLDAPRHAFLHTERSFNLICHEAGLRPSKSYYDSDDFQFFGSELYRRGIQLSKSSDRARHFSSRAIRDFKARAAQLNRERAGDQAVFVLECSTNSASESMRGSVTEETSDPRGGKRVPART
jgi:SAM-dependent methyltransferase